MKKFTNGLVVGKFAPLHKGHDYLIRTAIENCTNLVIIQYGSDEVGIASETIKSVLGSIYSSSSVCVPEAHLVPPSNDSGAYTHREYCANILKHISYIPDAVFTSEDYGNGFAEHLSNFFNHHVEHICVDIDRKKFPISGTECRNSIEKRKIWSLM